MGLFSQLAEKPWTPEQAAIDDRHKGVEFSLPTPQFGLRVFLGFVTVIFTLFVVVYVERMVFADWKPMPEPWLLWVNTAILVISSIGLQWAWVSADKGDADGVKKGLYLGGVLAFAFLTGQLLVWQQLVDLGYYASSNPASAFFYLFTALHAVHLLGGLVAWGRTAIKVKSGMDVAKVRGSVELCAVYWHFLLVIWIVIFGLLLFT